MQRRCRFLLRLAAVGLAALCFAGAGSAQELQLFEPVQGDGGSGPSTSGQRDQQSAGDSSGEPAFRLIGTSRFGDRYTVRLRNRDGESITVEGEPDSRLAVPGYPGHTITGIGSGRVTMLLPDDESCTGSRKSGVACVGANTARLELATAEAVERGGNGSGGSSRGNNGGGNSSDSSADSGEADNPFAAALRQARSGNRASNSGSGGSAGQSRSGQQQGGVRRIPPDEVPEGQRVVRTPFGDRLVPER